MPYVDRICIGGPAHGKTVRQDESRTEFTQIMPPINPEDRETHHIYHVREWQHKDKTITTFLLSDSVPLKTPEERDALYHLAAPLLEV